MTKESPLRHSPKGQFFWRCFSSEEIVLEKVGLEVKLPISAIRKCIRMQLIKNDKKITAFVRNDGSWNSLRETMKALALEFAGNGHAVGDIPGFHFVCWSSHYVPFGLVQKQEGKTKIINFDNGSTLINFHILKKNPKFSTLREPKFNNNNNNYNNCHILLCWLWSLHI